MDKTQIKMKNRWQLIAGLFLALATISFNSCVDDDFDEPPINIPKVDFERTHTIAELKATYSGLRQITEDIIIRGKVIANDESGNLYKKLEIQDETGGIELSLDENSLYTVYKLGQTVYVKCKDIYLGDYNELIQLGGLYNGKIGRLPQVLIPLHIFRDSLPGAVPAPQVITMNELSMDKVSTLVKFKNVRFSEAGSIWAPQTNDATDRIMLDENGKSLIVRTSKYANFASDTVPGGTGDVTGMLSIYRTTWQLVIRDTSDLKGFSSTVTPPPGGSGSGTKTDPFNVTKGISLQGQDTTGWVKGYIVGSVKSGVTSITSSDDIHFSAPFTSATNVLISDNEGETDYTRCIVVNLPSGKPLRTNVNLLDHPDNLGKELNVLGKLRTYFGVAGLRDAPGENTDYELEGGVTPPPPGGGSGTFDDPFDVNSARANNSGLGKWVQGYIVGVNETDVEPFEANFAAPFRTNTNLLLAQTADEVNLSNCLTVQLPAGAIRDALNLVDHPENKGKEVKLLGNLEAYFGQPGLKGLTGYWLDGNGIIPATGFFTEEFATNLGTFTAENITGAEVWEWANFGGGCAKMTGFANQANHVNEDWLISPSISLAGLTGVSMSFTEAINFITSLSDLQVLISTNYTSGNPNSATWTELTGFTRSPGNSWTFVESGSVSLAAYEGQNVRIAFKYLSSNSAGATWEIGRVVLSSSK